MDLRVGLMTLDARNNNYGGLLQEYALFKELVDLGYHVEVIDYDISSELNTFSYKRNLKFLTFSKMMKKIQKKILKQKVVESTIPNELSRDLFSKFRNQYITFSEKYAYDDLNELNSKYDGFVCGSDQIWNPSYNIPSFFLNFVTKKNKVIYGASLGVPTISPMEGKVYKDLLKNLKSISVREKKAKEIIASLTDKQVEVVLDPTMILDRDEWMQFAKKNKASEPYIFCYFLGMDSIKAEAAKKFAKKIGCQIVSVPFEHCTFSEDYFPTFQQGMGPEEFLNLIYNARFVLTDSFHASVFSIIFNKDFRVFSRRIGKSNMNDRLYTLLDWIDKKDLFIDPDELEKVTVDDSIVYDYSQIDKERVKSIQWLKNALDVKENEK